MAQLELFLCHWVAVLDNRIPDDVHLQRSWPLRALSLGWGYPFMEIRLLFSLVGREIPPFGRCSALKSGRLDAVG